MRDSLRRTCERFVQNQEMLKKTLRSGDLRLRSVCASMLLRAPYVEEDVLRESRDVLKQETGVFSNFRGFAQLASIVLLAMSGHPQTKITEAKETYRILKEEYYGCEYLALAALTLTDLVQPWQMEEVAVRGRKLYKRMKKEHGILTSQEDCGFSLLLAMDPRSDDLLIRQIEADYETLRHTFSAGNGLQSLTHVMALSGDTATCERVRELYYGLKENGLKYGRSYELSMLGVLAGLPVPTEELVQEMLEVDQFLAPQKGYGFWGCSKKTRLMHAAMLVCADRLKAGERTSASLDTAMLSGTIAMIAAEQAALCAIIAANAAATAAA